MERAVEMFVAVGLMGVGLSHFFRPLAWIEFFAWLRGQGRAGAFLDGLWNLNCGALIVAFHNVWQWPAAVITLLGWAMVIKGLFRLVAPTRFGLRIYDRIAPDRAWHFRVAGVLALVISALSAYLARST